MTKITNQPQIFAIGDFHLPGGLNKPMDVFGAHWEGHFDKISQDWLDRVGVDDIVLIPGDISWAMHLEAARADLEQIGRLPGSKIMIRGNHDYWWNSISRLRTLLPQGMYALQNDAMKLKGYVFCGSRGWSQPDREDDAENSKIYQRELMRMELSLQRGRALAQAGEPLIVLIHYPPTDFSGKATPMTELFERYEVNEVFYGHLHGPANAYAFDGSLGTVNYHPVSCDGLGFKLYELPVLME